MKSRGKGLLFAGLGASLWGSAGVTGQVLMDTYHLPATALSVWRLILSGLLLLGFDYLLHRESLLRPWKDRADALRLFVFAVFGMMGTQYFYFRAIQYSNAPTGTILQYLMSILLIFYTAFEERRLPRGMEISCAILAMAGTFLVVTGGDWHAVKISQMALFWGLLSALAEAVYVVEPIPLMERYRPSLLVGWGMLAGGVALIPFMDAPITAGVVSFSSLMVFLLCVLFGTVVPFLLFLMSVAEISPGEAGILGAMEPLSSLVLSLLFLTVSFSGMQITGVLVIVAAVVLVSSGK